MKTNPLLFGFLFALLAPVAGAAITFTNDTFIDRNNLEYEGQDIVVTNCAVTLDGLHAFKSLQVLQAGKVTSTNGLIPTVSEITAEPHVLTSTNAEPLNYWQVITSSVVVRDISGTVTYTNGADYQVALDTNNTAWLQLAPGSAIVEGSTNLVDYQVHSSYVATALNMTVTGDVFVARGGAIDVNGKGSAGGTGMGAGGSGGSPMTGSGGGYGGLGGSGAGYGPTGAVYGPVSQPLLGGSGGGAGYGGPGGAGGGAIKLTATGLVQVEGTISANGANGINRRSGGGSGGSIWLIAPTLAGSGRIIADGGSGEPGQGGGGGGGRIALQVGQDVFLGQVSAQGGNGFAWGGPGTIFKKTDSDSMGRLLFENGGHEGWSVLNQGTVDVSVQGGAVVTMQSYYTIGNLSIGSNAWLYPNGSMLTVTGNATIDAGGGLVADGQGYPANQGLGAGRFYPYLSAYAGGGGGYGGCGANGLSYSASGGLTYGNVISPMERGSGGGSSTSLGGGAGGGVIRLTVTGTLILNGRISADGLPGLTDGSGGGSGGSVSLNVGTLAGAGAISANGGSGNGFGLYAGGGGGGGRIAVQSTANLFFGQVTAYGGSGCAFGGAGTIYTKMNNQSLAQVLVDNGGQRGTNSDCGTLTSVIDVIVRGGALVPFSRSQSVANLLVGSNSAVVLSGTGNSMTVSYNATVEQGGIILADGLGSGANSGPGAGRYYSSIGGGGGYGGYGASGANSSQAFGGTIYGSLMTPTDLGSGGGSSSYGGGPGGGAIRATVMGALRVDGTLSCNGGAGTNSGAGGGSGGSIYLTVGSVSGSGVISANGGNGMGSGGGGGGGRIALEHYTNVFFGSLTACGGGGGNKGGAGTIYLKPRNQQTGQLFVDNGGQTGTNTVLTLPSSSFDFVIRGGARAAVSYTPSYLGNLFIGSNSWLFLTNGQVNVNSNLVIEAGGGIVADGAGSPANSGLGAGRYYSGSGGGGGYGGYGANGFYPLAYGGNIYGSLTTPQDMGSGGGGPTSFPPSGGAGGGSVRISVTGGLDLDGRISANGMPASGWGFGGGSGGSIWLTAGTLSGSGLISANGGDGVGAGGGGGGGRIAIQYAANGFSGNVMARGGLGYAVGGAGTIYLARTPNYDPQLIVDNGGLAGTNTSWLSGPPANINVAISGGAVLAPPLGPLALGSLLIGPASWLVLTNQAVTVTSNAIIELGGGILADGAGSGSGSGIGAGRASGSSAGGGGYGGYGASGAPTTGPLAFGGNGYGSLVAPLDAGSGGGGLYISPTTIPGGFGGGIVNLTVNGGLLVDGKISANGMPAGGLGAGGGSGGSINLIVGTLSGVGLLSVNGGAGLGLGGGGGGGRIAIQYAANAFSGGLEARGGSGYGAGGAGTIYTKANNQSVPRLVMDNGGQSGTNTAFLQSPSMDLVLTGGASFSLPNYGQLVVNTLLVGSNSWIFVSGSQLFTIAGGATVQAGGGISATGGGSGPGSGMGAGRYVSIPGGGYAAGGGGYGGFGGSGLGVLNPSCGGISYGSASVPQELGSGGGSYSYGGGRGGGSIRMNVTGTLAVDGSIVCDGTAGTNSAAGGGSGGSLYLSVGTLSGSGLLSANGGTGIGAGGGGGGRIALYYGASAFSGDITAYGGAGQVPGGAGTIYTKANKQSMPQILADNGGQVGTNTSWNSSGTADLVVRGGAIVAPMSQTLNSLLVASNSALWLSTQVLTINGNATVDAGGAILAEGSGYGSGSGSPQGPGSGQSFNEPTLGFVGGGGGYGGYGTDAGASRNARGGDTYGSASRPLDRGSAGGGYQSYGGAGGGAINITVYGTLALNGRVSANGVAGAVPGAGGGSGGSVWLVVGTLAGSGSIAANGGMGNGAGGGGGGGRVALEYSANSFGGVIAAQGGSGQSGWGGAGTVYRRLKSQPTGSLLVDNGGHFGTNTSLSSLANPYDLTVRNGAVLVPAGSSLVLSNLVVGQNGTFLSGQALTNFDLAVLGNATIEAGGALSADGRGFAAMSGPGAGLSSEGIGSGGGYGGRGGASSVQPGGNSYGVVDQPTDPGSGGGYGFVSDNVGGQGGGAIRLSVGRALTVNGRLSANGSDGLQDDSGGGSGGSLFVSAGILAGTGSISADGGAGELYLGGGGGGGRIAIYAPINAYSGTVSAAGGEGFARGEDGSINTYATLVPLVALAHSPTGVLTQGVSQVDFTFNMPVNGYTLSPEDVLLYAPTGAVAQSDLSVNWLSAAALRVSFPEQNSEGAYRIELGPLIQNLQGQPMSQVYTGAFAIVWPVMAGVVTDANSQPVPDTLLQADSGVAAVSTDTNGYYSLKVPPGGVLKVTPSKPGLVFVPSSRSYVNLAGSLTDQNYVAVTNVISSLTSHMQNTNLVLSWTGCPGVSYQTLCSTNLVDWALYRVSLTCTNFNTGLQLLVPVDESPGMFFRVQANY